MQIPGFAKDTRYIGLSRNQHLQKSIVFWQTVGTMGGAKSGNLEVLERPILTR